LTNDRYAVLSMPAALRCVPFQYK